MKLDRNINPDGKGKYALLKQRELSHSQSVHVSDAVDMLSECGIIDYGGTPETDFFVIRLKDKYAAPALEAYANAALLDDQDEYAKEIFVLAHKARTYPSPRMPD